MMIDVEDFETAKTMMTESQYHQSYSDEDIRRFIKPPLSLGNYIIMQDKNGLPFVFATWAFPEMWHVDEYFKTNKFPPKGFRGSGESPWIIDFIAVGGFQNIRTGFRYLKDRFMEMGYIDCYWLRTESKKVGFHKLKEH